jgi:hypothetical protein
MTKHSLELIYCPDPINWHDWSSANKIMDRNWQRLEKCDSNARALNTVIGRYFRVPCADGYAVYQIISETRTRVILQPVTGIGDDWQDHHFGGGGSFSKPDILRYLKQEDGWKEYQKSNIGEVRF